MRRIFTLLILGFLFASGAGAQSYKFDFTSGKKVKDGYIKITSADRYDQAKGYGYDLCPSPDGRSKAPFFFSVAIPDGNYHVTAIVGSKRNAGETTLRGESRRLFYENVKTKKGELLPCSFTINKRDIYISDKEDVRIKPRERSKLNWDDKLTLEFNGDAPQLTELIIERVANVPTIFLCGNSTVVDQDNEPWASWGQMVPRFFTDSGAQPVLVTPTQRRSFDENGKIKDTHLDFPDAVRWLAEKENIPLIDLHAMTRVLYEAMGVEESKHAFVHYPANTYPGQDRPLADNTHFNPYGAYQIAKCVIEGMKKAGLPVVKFLRADYQGYNPSQPDNRDSFKWNDIPFTEVEKPDGN